MSTTKIRFNNQSPANFVKEVKLRVGEYFEETGRSRHADGRMIFKTILLVGITIGAYALILTNWFTPLQMLGLSVVVGFGMAGIGFCVSHDALHGAYSANPRVNRMLGYSFDLIGANGYMWKITHNVIHHTYTNIEGIDEDLDVSPLLRLSPGAPLHWIHRYQHRYALLAYGMATLNWVFAKDYQQFLKRDLGPYKNKKHPRKEVIHLVWTKLFCYAYTIVIPLLVLDVAWWQFLIGFLAMHLTAGTILGVIFQLAHVVEGPEYPAPDDKGAMEHAWLIHEMHTTADFAQENRLLSWYIGGLNFQIEHHLFPVVPRPNLPAVQRIVRKYCARYNIPYTQRDVRGAAKTVLSYLNQVGMKHRDPYICPLVQRYRP